MSVLSQIWPFAYILVVGGFWVWLLSEAHRDRKICGELEGRIAALESALDGDDDPDPSDEDEEVLPDNIIAIGRRAA